MRATHLEQASIAGTVTSMVIALAWPFVHEARSVKAHAAGARVVTLTGVAAAGVWTDREVRGGNYFARAFPPASFRLKVGERVVLRLKSADVTHTFYCPELHVGPIEVYPGLVRETTVVGSRPGAFGYYCTTVCGRPHFRMRGQIVVEGDGMAAAAHEEDAGEYWKEPPPAGDHIVERGQWLFRKNGCFTCHGADGHGGVANPNYVKGTVPALDRLSERMFLYNSDDVRAIVAILAKGASLEKLEDDPPVPRFGALLAQYQSIRKVVRDGNQAGKLDPGGPTPPLSMLPWGQRLSDREIDAVIAYLLTRQPLHESEKP